MIGKRNNNSIQYPIPLSDRYWKQQDKRFDYIHSLLSKYDCDDILFIEENGLLVECLKIVKEQKLSGKFKKIIIYMSELYWDSVNEKNQKEIDDLLDYNIFVIFNFLSDKSPFDLKTKSYTSIGSFLDITNLYLQKYDFKQKSKKYNLISKFGRPQEDRIKFYNELKDYDSFVYSINNFQLDYKNDDIPSKKFESEKQKTGDYKSNTLPTEDFESVFSLDMETRCSSFQSSSKLIQITEKTLKSFMFKRPSIIVIQKEAFDYLESFGFEFPNYFGLDYKTQQLEICKRICELSLEECKDLSSQYKDVYEKNYQKLVEFLEHHKTKLENIFYELYHK